jgi:hypothetical protein
MLTIRPIPPVPPWLDADKIVDPDLVESIRSLIDDLERQGNDLLVTVERAWPLLDATDKAQGSATAFANRLPGSLNRESDVWDLGEAASTFVHILSGAGRLNDLLITLADAIHPETAKGNQLLGVTGDAD